MSNYYTVHMDQDYWKDPSTFRPERFLSDNGQYQADERIKSCDDYISNCSEVFSCKTNIP